MRHISAALALSSLLLCQPALAQREGEPVRIAHAEAFPPLTEVKDGKSEGLAVDILRVVAERAGVDVKFVAVPFEQTLITLADGRADACFPIAITAERRQSFDFTEVLVVTGGTLFVRAPNAPPENLTPLSGKIVVTPRTGPIAGFIEKTAPAVNLVVPRRITRTVLPASCAAKLMRPR